METLVNARQNFAETRQKLLQHMPPATTPGIIATVYFIVDSVFSHVTRPITVWLAKKKFLERARLWITSLRPYPSLAIFAVPVIMLEPAKPLAGYLLGTGHFFFGAVTFITAEVLKLTLVERLFQLNRKKLLSIPAFAWGYRYWR
jgi:hypothetical protein